MAERPEWEPIGEQGWRTHRWSDGTARHTANEICPGCQGYCAACGAPDPDGPTDSYGLPWCSACHDAGEVAP